MSRVAKKLMGETLDNAIGYLESNNIPWCVIRMDKVDVSCEEEYLTSRIQLEVDDKIVTKVTFPKASEEV